MRRLLVIVALALALTAVLAAPASAAPPHQTQEPAFGIVGGDSGYIGFINITRDNFCAWIEAEDFEAPPPVNELVTVNQKVTGKGAIVEQYRAQHTIEVWVAEGDPCADDAELWATGMVWVTATDNDLFVSGSRANAFGGSGHGTVVDADGQAWRVQFVFRAVITPDGEFRLLVDRFTLRAL